MVRILKRKSNKSFLKMASLTNRIPSQADKGVHELLNKIAYTKISLKKEKEKDKQIDLMFRLQGYERELNEIEPKPELGR